MFRYILLIIILLFSVFPVVSGTESNQNQETTENSTPPPSCQNIATLLGPQEVRKGVSSEYNLVIGSGGDTKIVPSVFKIIKGEETIDTTPTQEKYLRYFREPGNIIIRAQGILDGCEYTGEIHVEVFNMSISYLGKADSLISPDIADLLRKKAISIQTIARPNDSAIISNSDMEFLRQSDIIILQDSNLLSVLSELGNIEKNQPLSFSDKKIIIASDLSESFLAKVIAGSISRIGVHTAYIIRSQSIPSTLVLLSEAENPQEFEIGEKVSYEQDQNIWSFSSLFINLAYNGLSYNFLSLLLMIIVTTLIVNIIKQVVGFNGYGVYSPIIVALCASIIGIPESVLIFGSGITAYLITLLITHKIYLLVHAKRSLFISIFIVLFLIALRIINNIDAIHIDLGILGQPVMIIVLVISTFVIEKTFQESGNGNILKTCGYILQFLTLSGILYLVFHAEALKYFLVSFPDVVIILFVLHIIIGRYSGLQIVEYFRFLPLLRREESEE